jgi:hypothetical protein
MKFLWLSVLMLLIGGSAQAGMLSVLDLRLHPDPAWQRGTPEQEREDDALLLSWPVPDGIALQLVIPRSPPLIKSDAETFYRNLTQKWSAQYGREAAVGWIDLGGGEAGSPRWLSCRRPARSGEGVVFHLASVHEGRAYSLLLFAPRGTEALPKAFHDVVAGAGFQAMPPIWRKSLALPLLPRGEAMEAMAQAEVEALGASGLLTGYGVRAEGNGVEPDGELRLYWFLDGFRWAKKFGRDERVPFEVRGQLAAAASRELDGGTLKVELKVGASEATQVARVSLHSYCGPQGPWQEALASLGRGARGPLDRLRRDHACDTPSVSGELGVLEARSGQTVARVIPLALPATAKAGMRWLEVNLEPGVGGTVGERLLDRVGLFYIYAQEK